MVYSLDTLRCEYQKGISYQFLFFWGHTSPADGKINQSCLSQWWMQDFVIDDIRYSCAEQYMMAEKARLFNDELMLEKIMKADLPKEMKAYGRTVQNFDKEIWEAHCYHIVKNASRAKFVQNSELLEFLLGTAGRILVEASPRDRIWGIGMGKSNPDADNPIKWRGKNLLGFALTEVRDELLRENKEHTSKTINLKDLDNKVMSFLMAFRSENKFDDTLFDEIYVILEGLVKAWKIKDNIPKEAFLSCFHLIYFLAGGNRFLSDEDSIKVEDACISLDELINTLEQ